MFVGLDFTTLWVALGHRHDRAVGRVGDARISLRSATTTDDIINPQEPAQIGGHVPASTMDRCHTK
jgi:hypothetical protein